MVKGLALCVSMCVKMKFLFLLNCDKLREQHQSFEQKLGKFSIKHFTNLTNEEKLIFFFSIDNPGICRILAQTIHNTFQVRGNTLKVMICTLDV